MLDKDATGGHHSSKHLISAIATTMHPAPPFAVQPIIRIAVLDDHPMVRAGLRAILAAEPDLQAVGFAADEAELRVLLARTRPDVVVLDLYHPGRDGLTLALDLTRRPDAPRVVLYSASVGLVAATVAGADAVVSKSADTRTLLEEIRAARPRPQVSRGMRAAAAAKLDVGDHAIFAMRLAGDTSEEIADTLGLSVTEVADRTSAIVATLAPARADRSRALAGAGSAV
jgi:DNA-binding NarL/FixJ family response regulator